MKELCVVHLVRELNGIEPFERFLKSYRQNPGGIDHDLLIIFKGFNSDSEKAEHLKLLAPFRHSTLDVADVGFDITAYFTAAREFASEYRYFCFLNSFSVILDNEWLRKLYEQISRPGIGLAGATGSWQSLRGSGIFWLMMAMVGAAILDYRLLSNQPVWRRLTLSTTAGWQHGSFLRNFNQFPNYHVRTNAFMISSELMKKIKFQEIITKTDAYKFESGISGLTQQVLEMGKTILVVGKDGIGYEMERWNKSMTFWQSEQENLLVADNQTCDYQYGTMERRQNLSNGAWVEFTGWYVLKNKVRRFWRKNWKKSTGSNK
ncbi:MAG: hypothetical protein HY935_07720 [Nitrosomonadales bacterium]|nr:hypothetical protein [Nitrosomonadales bacterium]